MPRVVSLKRGISITSWNIWVLPPVTETVTRGVREDARASGAARLVRGGHPVGVPVHDGLAEVRVDLRVVDPGLALAREVHRIGAEIALIEGQGLRLGLVRRLVMAVDRD